MGDQDLRDVPLGVIAQYDGVVGQRGAGRGKDVTGWVADWVGGLGWR